MSVSSIVSQHGFVVARVAAETDDYARLVRSTVGPSVLLGMVLSYSTSVKLREVFVPILFANKVRVITGSSSDMDTARNIFAALDELCANPPKHRLLTSTRGRDLYVVADAGTNLDLEIRRALSDQRFIEALQASDIADSVNHEIERLKRSNLI